MPLIYAFVARGTVVLTEYTSYSGNFATIAVQCLEKVSKDNSRCTLTCDRHTFNFVIDEGYTYLAVADESFGRQIPFAFLEKVRSEFKEKFGEKGRTALAHSLDKAFGPRIHALMDYCMEHPDELSKVAAVQKKVTEVKSIMSKNIETVLGRGERLEVLVNKTDDLRSLAKQFQDSGRQLRSKMWWQNFKVKVIAAAVLLVVIFVIFVAICFSGGNCLRRN